MTFVFVTLSQGIVFLNKKGRAETRLTSQMAEQLRVEMSHQPVWCVCGGRLCPLLTTTPPTSPPPGTHDAVGRWRAPDEALDLALFPMQGMLGLGAGDDGGSIDSQGHLSLPSPNAGHHGSAHVFPRVLLANGFEGQRLLIAQDHARAPLHPDDGQGRVACPGAAEDGVRAQVYEQRLGLCGHPVSCLENPMDRGAWRAKSRT